MARRERLPNLIIQVDTSGIDRMFDAFIGEVGAAVRPAAQAGAQVLYDEVKRNVGSLKTVTGNLNRSIYQAYSPEQSTDNVSATYNISWNKTKAPHGWLVEYGHLQRYRYYQNAQGQVRPMVRPGMDGRKKPSKGAPQSVKDAYYVTLPTPIQIAGKAFMRRAADKAPLAFAAMEQKLFEILSGSKGGLT
jgi:hypothetical protein